ncbi:hypothetical protein [Aestuariirhabdus litorea]|uniref:Uncharacterized protein n=1 Tax=Aestuariirhabdus litorea TaxID=2528527 RepID=A0A3P3VT08_9GAMM|nr:hypothetical protein [Aestuariirhabdus litorea]RRJ83903.1 hypothetical protein D0544_01930 [Aestuariirhabdus litorea]RWW97126.1 hypothetical protein DZC74_01935 [Endozoicomonadaceae bacterium GTF-13]
MSLTINAWMEADQQLCLDIRNLETGGTELEWRFNPLQAGQEPSNQALKQLFRQLLLLSCKSRISIP